MSEPTLRTRIRAYYASSGLPEERLARLRALARASRRPASRRLLAIAWLAAAVAGITTVAVFLSGRVGSATEEVAREIVRNHRKDLDPELRSASYEEINARMGRLDFRVVEPRLPEAEGLQLLGARYCSLQGRIAAQLRLVREDGRSCTLYEVKDGAAFGGVEPARLELDGVAVQVWRQDGLVLGLAVATE